MLPRSKAPDFSLPADDWEHGLTQVPRRHAVVLYFFPRTTPPVAHDRGLRIPRPMGSGQKAGAVVLGVSPDPVNSHSSSAESTICPSHSSPIPTTRSPRRTAPGREEHVRRKYQGILRSTFVIDGQGPDRESVREGDAEGTRG
jgi:peroxiredoxin Q/BCP